MCITCSRRGVLVSLLSTAGIVLLPHAATTQTPIEYCGAKKSALKSFDLRSTSGIDALDSALISELKEMIRIIPVNPGFQFIVNEGGNAFAVNRTIIPNTKGTILIGLDLIKGEMDDHNLGGIAIAGICAHECGHIYQFFSHYEAELSDATHKYIELHADAIAGYYLQRRGWSFSNVEIFGNSLFNKGDYEFNNRHHHGSPQQRVAAMREGFSLAARGKIFEDAARDSANYIRGLFCRRTSSGWRDCR